MKRRLQNAVANLVIILIVVAVVAALLVGMQYWRTHSTGDANSGCSVKFDQCDLNAPP